MAHPANADPDAYVPGDRRRAIAAGRELPERAHGAVLFADVAGFTPLTEALVDGAFTATAALRVDPGPIAGLRLPAGLSTPAGTPVTVPVTGVDGYGNVVADLSTQAVLTITPWQHDGAAGATCAGGACTAPTPGTYRVLASVGRFAAATLLTVTEP